MTLSRRTLLIGGALIAVVALIVLLAVYSGGGGGGGYEKPPPSEQRVAAAKRPGRSARRPARFLDFNRVGNARSRRRPEPAREGVGAVACRDRGIRRNRGRRCRLVVLGRASSVCYAEAAPPFGSAALYSAALVFLGKEADLWQASATKATVYWFFGTAVILVGRARQIAPDCAPVARQ